MSSILESNFSWIVHLYEFLLGRRGKVCNMRNKKEKCLSFSIPDRSSELKIGSLQSTISPIDSYMNDSPI